LQDLRRLYEQITQDKGKPLDFWEVAALLEVYGIRDVDAKNEYGFENVFELAKYLFERYADSKTYPQKYLIDQEKIPPLKKRIVRHYFKGLAFAMPMLMQIVFTLVFGFALWSNVDLDVTDATVIALGTFMALVVSGGPAQIIGRKGLYYLKMGEKLLAGKMMQVLLVHSLVKIVAVALFVLLLNLLFNFFDGHLLYLFMASFFLLAVLFVVSSVYYVFEEYEKIFLFYLLGVGLVFVMHYGAGLGFPDAQFAALALLDIVFALFAWRKTVLLRRSSQSEGEVLPRASMLVYTLLPFYVYGVLYFFFLILDRLVAWNANSLNRGFFVWFDVTYEIGSDMALVVLVLLMGAVEVIVYEFLYNLNTEVFRYSIDRYREFNRQIERFYKKSLRMFIIYFLVSIIVVSVLIFAIKASVRYKLFPFGTEAFLVYGVAAVAFGFLTVGLLNTLVLFSFSRQEVVVRAIFFGLLTNFATGVVLANMVDARFAVFGLLAGSFVFWYTTQKAMRRVLEKLDYYYYSAF